MEYQRLANVALTHLAWHLFGDSAPTLFRFNKSIISREIDEQFCQNCEKNYSTKRLHI
jgi:hypothetical protein